MRPARSRSNEPRSAATNVRNVWRPTWITTYEPANSSAFAPKACGIAIAMSMLTSISAISSSRTTIESGSSSFVTHAV